MSDVLEANRSFGNPADLAMMKQRGDVQPGMTVRDFLQKQGIDVDGPIEQLTKFAQKQAGNAGAMGKMRNIAGSMPRGMGGAAMGGAPGGMPPAGGMDELMKNLG